MITALIVLIIVVVVVLAGLYFVQRHYNDEYAQQAAARNDLVESQLGERIHQVAGMKLAGESNRKFEQLQKTYHDSVEGQIGDITSLLGGVPDLIKAWKIPTVARDLHDCADLIASTKQAANSVSHGLTAIERVAQANEAAIDSLQTTYHHLDRELNEDSFKFGPSIDELRSRFNDLEKQYDQFTKLMASGDQDAAAEQRKTVRSKTTALEEMVKRVPGLYKPLATDYLTQVKELRSGYQTLTNQHYHFAGGNLPSRIDKVADRISRNSTALTALKLDAVEKENKAIADEIDHLYGVMQKELDARPQVQRQMPVIGRFLRHAQGQESELLAELRRLSENYTFTKHEMETARQLNEQLKTIDSQYQKDHSAIENQTATDSEVLSHLQDAAKELKEIETSQEKVNDSVASMQEDEVKARHALTKFDAELRTTKRRVTALNLPGLPKRYLDSFYLVSDEISKLQSAIDQPRINMDEITKQLIIVQSDLETLQERTNDMRDSAELTERLLQYSNRLVDDHPDVEKAAEKAKEQYGKFQYDASLETIATALEDAEPGSYKRLENSYYQTAKQDDQL